MGTAVLQPRDCLASRRQNCHFLPASECPSAVTRSSGRGSSRQNEASSFAFDCARRQPSGDTSLVEGRGLLGRKKSSTGLLPLPDQVLQSIHPSFQRSAPNISSYMLVPGQVTPFGPDAADPCLSRCPSMPSLDYETPILRGFSDCSHILSESHIRRPPGGNQFVARNCMVASYQKLKPPSNIHPSNVNDPVHLGRQSLKPPFEAFPDMPGKPTCKVISTVGRKHGGRKQLKRSISEKFQERTKMSIVQRPSTKEAARKLITSLFQEVDEYKSSGSPASFVQGKIEGILGQGSLDVGPQESCRKLDSKNRWLPTNYEEKWAGPSFFNSPAPSALPVPSFASKFSRLTPICSAPARNPDCGGQIVLGNSCPETKSTWDVTFATKDLRRLLNLDGSSCDI